MASIGATALNIPIQNSFVSEDSPVFNLKPIFFAVNQIYKTENTVTDEINEWDPVFPDRDNFKEKVKQRKLRGFVGNEYTLEEAFSKQSGPEGVEARAFLEYYWEMREMCLEAVEKGRDSEVEAFERHPLFSLDWLVPRKRWSLKNGIETEENKDENEENEIVIEENEIRKKENHIVKDGRLNRLTSRNLVEPRKQVVGGTLSAASYNKIPVIRAASSSQNERNESKRRMPLRDIRKQVVGGTLSAVSDNRIPVIRAPSSSKNERSESKNGMPIREIKKHAVGGTSSSISYNRIPVIRGHSTSKDEHTKDKIRKQMVGENSISYKRDPVIRNLGRIERKPTESKTGRPLREIRKLVVRKEPSSVSSKRFAATGDVGHHQYKRNENREGTKIPVLYKC
ncbi:uncharacterized protein [Halyomorpha halys]|uniref:uncharacterized protein n=1 Tax=Halyomorpha halys TaxID=286706 RepID=UPI0006D4E6F0|nr:uncharacterized protein LOC106686439 [Halyomorpha halys]